MDIKGLTDKEVKESRAKFGSNVDDRDVFLWICGDL